MEFDVVVVGAGPAGLSAAIRLKQLNPELAVVVVEKGSEVGAHILSGAVIDPIGLDRLLPEWRNEDTPIKTPVTDDRFYWLGPAGGMRLPNFLMPPLMSNHGNFIVSLGNVCRWLATKAEGARRRDLSGLRGRRSAVRRERRGRRRRDRRHGRRQGPPAQGPFTRGMELRGKYTLFAEGARGSLAKTDHREFDLARDREPQKFGIGLKELWKVAPEKHQPGLVQHTFGWPLDNSTGGGSFLYHFDDNQVSVGFVVHLNYRNPYLAPFEEFQRFKTHPLIRADLRGRQAHLLRRARHHRRRLAVRAEARFPGGALIGCAAGFINVPRIKGSHNAILSGMLAAEHVAAALADGRAAMSLPDYEAAWRGSEIGRDLKQGAQRQAALVALRHARRRRARRPRHVDQQLFGFSLFGTLSHGKPDFGDAGAGRASSSRSIIRSPTACSPSTSSPRCSCRTPITRRTSRCI